MTESFGAPRITEFMASNVSRLADEDGDFPDWIEVHNPDNVAVPLAGYHLTDDAANLDKWTFPAVTLDPGAILVVFASGKNRNNPASRLHTNFRLSADGDYLALVAPDGVTVVSASLRPIRHNSGMHRSASPHWQMILCGVSSRFPLLVSRIKAALVRGRLFPWWKRIQPNRRLVR